MTDERFRTLFTDHFPDVWRFARRRTSSAEEADDVAAETFAVAWRRRDDVPADETRPWLFGVARLVLANHYRDLRRRDRLHLRLAAVGDLPTAYEQQALPDDLTWTALAALSVEDRDLLLMRGWDDLSVADIAEVLQIPAATVSSRLHRARQRLKHQIDRQDPAGPGHVSSTTPERKATHRD